MNNISNPYTSLIIELFFKIIITSLKGNPVRQIARYDATKKANKIRRIDEYY